MSDILDYDLRIFSRRIDGLVRRIAEHLPRERLWDLLDWFSPPPEDEFEARLEATLAELEADARTRGWERKT